MGRISAGTIILGIFAIMFGLTGAYVVRRYMEKPPVAPVLPPAPRREVIPLASTDLVAGKVLALGDIMLVPMTQEQIQAKNLSGSFTNAQMLVGRVLREPRKTGEGFFSTSLYPQGMRPNIGDNLKPGYRAVTVPIKQDLGSLSGLAQPGSAVDVLFRISRNAEGQPIPETTFTLITGAEVVAVGANMVSGTAVTGNPTSVTLAVTPDQANKLKVVEGRGELSLVVRNSTDSALADAGQGLTIDRVLGLPPKPIVPPPPAKPEPFVTEIYRRGSRQTILFDRDKVMKDAFTGTAPSIPGVAPRPMGQVPPPLDPLDVPPNVNELK